MINPVWLKTFCTLVDVGHFTQTADALFMTQSGVSQQVKKLEEQLDTPLLIREGKSFSLTDAGMKLHQQGRILLDNVAELASSIKQDEAFSGRLKIASPGSVGLKLYPHLLSIQQQNPNLVFDYIFAPNGDIAEKVSKREIDIGLVTAPSKMKNIAYQEVANEPLVLITSNEFSSVEWHDLMTLGFISHPDAEHHAQQLLRKNFKEFKHIEQFTHKGFSNQISLILEPVSRGIGFTVLPLHAVNAFHDQTSIHIHALSNPESETIYFCSNHHALKSKRSNFVKSEIRKFLN